MSILCKTRLGSVVRQLTFLKTGIFNRKFVQTLPRGRAGMTLIEVVVALAIAGLTVAGIITGYIFCMTLSAKDALAMAANAKVMERIEQTRSAQWDTSVWPAVDELVASNFPDLFITLDKSASGSDVISATIKTDISQISLTPQIRKIRVDCIWQFKGVELITNTIETCRAPDQ